MVNDKTEDDYIKDFLMSHYSNINHWRTGANKMRGQWVWHTGSSKKGRHMTYTAWQPNFPGKYGNMMYDFGSGKPRTFVWKATWFGSQSQLPKFGYPFICEKSANGKISLC